MTPQQLKMLWMQYQLLKIEIHIVPYIHVYLQK